MDYEINDERLETVTNTSARWNGMFQMKELIRTEYHQDFKGFVRGLKRKAF